MHVCFCCVKLSFLSIKPGDWLGKYKSDIIVTDASKKIIVKRCVLLCGIADSRMMPICRTTAVCSKMEISVYGKELRRKIATCTSICVIFLCLRL